METKKTEMNKPCYIINSDAKKIETKFTVNDHEIEIIQRRLTGKEKELYKTALKDIYTDKDIYKAALAQKDIEKKIEDAKKREAKNGEEFKLEFDEDFSYIIHKGRVKIEAKNREVQAKFIAWSCSDAELYEGSFLVDGKSVSFEKKLAIIEELGEDDENDVDYFELLLANANRLTYPTKEEVEVAKS